MIYIIALIATIIITAIYFPVTYKQFSDTKNIRNLKLCEELKQTALKHTVKTTCFTAVVCFIAIAGLGICGFEVFHAFQAESKSDTKYTDYTIKASTDLIETDHWFYVKNPDNTIRSLPKSLSGNATYPIIADDKLEKPALQVLSLEDHYNDTRKRWLCYTIPPEKQTVIAVPTDQLEYYLNKLN